MNQLAQITLRQGRVLSKKFLKQLPSAPGVYVFVNKAKRIIYIGKAKILRARVSSYFNVRPGDSRYEKLIALTLEIEGVWYIEVASEVEALLLEAELIRRYLPRYNAQWRDESSPLYIKINVGEQLPIVTLVRREKPSKGVRLFGPFPSSHTVRTLMRQVRRVFPFYTSAHHVTRRCFYCHLTVCPGPIKCVDQREYRRNIRRLLLFLSGKKETLTGQLVQKMHRASRDQRFEEAARIKRFIQGIDYITQPIRSPEIYIEQPSLLEDERTAALNRLKDLFGLSTLPGRIEAYDIANISGTAATGALVVATAGELDKSGYRKFRIRAKQTPDDVGMLTEVLTRRFKHDWPTPSILLVDGGIAQARAAQQVLDRHGFKVLCVGLAKKQERLVLPDGRQHTLSRRDPGLQLLMRLRDEAHRFCRSYHHLLRSKLV